MTLREQIAADATGVFLKTNDFAETVIYYPRAGGSRSIGAVVERDPAAIVSEDGTVMYAYMVHVANNATTGISGKELDVGGDKISFPPRDGEPRRERTIWRVSDTDNGMHYLECR